MIRHVVMLRFDDERHAPEAKARLEALAGRIPELLTLQVDLDVLRSDASYDLCLVTTHEDLPGLQAYQAHPAHAEFLAWMRPLLRDRATVDAEV